MKPDGMGVGPDGKVKIPRTGIEPLDILIGNLEQIANLPVEAKPFIAVAFAAISAALLRTRLVSSPMAQMALSMILAEVSRYMDGVKSTGMTFEEAMSSGTGPKTEGPGSKVLSMAEFIRRSPKGRGGESY